MRNVEWKSRQGPVCYPIYTREEADELGITYRDPRGGVAEGDWVLCDDGNVTKLLKIGSFGDRVQFIRIPTGTFALTDRIHTDDRPSRYTLSGAYRTQSHQKATAQWTQFALLVSSGMPPEAAYRAVYPGSQNPGYIREKATALLKKEEVRVIMAKKVEEVLEALGVDNEFIIRRYKQLAENADSDAVSIAALNSLSRISGLIEPPGARAAKQVPVFLGLTNEQLQAAEAAYTRPITGIVVEDKGTLEIADGLDE